MKYIAITSILLGLLAVIVVTHPTVQYRIEDVSDSGFTKTMNELGADGWELVFARRASDDITHSVFSYEVIFKRRCYLCTFTPNVRTLAPGTPKS
jgi:hypothetical protein